ncbi:MAG: LPS export ABC transporter periplasmic protein LptC [Acidobacteriota bacterium]
MRRRARSPFRWLRRALLLAGVFGLVGLGVMLFAYNFGKMEPVPATPREQGLESQPSGMVTSGEGIVFVQTSGGEEVFRVTAERSVEGRDGQSHLENVRLTVPRQDGEKYHIKSDRAQVDQEQHEAKLEGNVRITGWGDLVLESRAIEVLDKGAVMISHGTVEFRYPPDLIGRASKMRIDKTNNAVTLSEGVHLHTVDGVETPMRLDCQRLVFKRSEGLIRAVDRVQFRHGDQHLQAHYLSLYLNEDRSLRTLQARWRINGGMNGLDAAGGEQQIRYHGQFLEIEPSPIDPENRTVILRGNDEQPAAMSMRHEDGLSRDLVAYELQARTLGSEIASIQAAGTPLELDEFLAMDDGGRFQLRRVCARRMVAGFQSDGSLGQLFMEEQVELSDVDVHVSGAERAVVDVAQGRMELDGPLVTLSTDQGDLSAPDINFSRTTGLIKAQGGVEARLDPGAATSLSASPLGEGEGPINVQSREAHWTQAPPGFVFRDDVRAWRGKNLLLAEQLRGDEASGEMAASGSVTTIWVPTRAGAFQAAAAPAADPTAAGETQPIEVTAATVSYRQTENQLIYSGGVRLLQASRTLRCHELAVQLEPGTGAAKRMRCRDNVELLDPVGGNTVTGETALYEVAAERVEIFGEEVKLVDVDSNEAVGRYLRYDLGSGETRLSSRPPDAGPTGTL